MKGRNIEVTVNFWIAVFLICAIALVVATVSAFSKPMPVPRIDLLPQSKPKATIYCIMACIPPATYECSLFCPKVETFAMPPSSPDISPKKYRRRME